MAKRQKSRRSISDILASYSEVLFPAHMGEASVRLDSAGSEGDTPLHVALWRQDFHAIQMLIEAGSDINAIGEMSETPLHIAVRRQNGEAIKMLLEAGARQSIRSEFGQTPADLADDVGGSIKMLFD